MDLSRFLDGSLPVTEGWASHSALAYPSHNDPNAVMMDVVVSHFPVPMKHYREWMGSLGAFVPSNQTPGIVNID